MKKNRKRIVIGMILLLVLLCSCGKKEESPYKELALETKDFRQVNFGASPDAVKAAEGTDPAGEYDADNIGEAEGIDESTIMLAKMYKMQMLVYENVMIGERPAQVAYFFLNNMLVLTVMGYEETNEAEQIYTDMKAYYTELLGEPVDSAAAYCQFQKDQGSKFLMLAYDKDQKIVGMTVMDAAFLP